MRSSLWVCLLVVGVGCGGEPFGEGGEAGEGGAGGEMATGGGGAGGAG